LFLSGPLSKISPVSAVVTLFTLTSLAISNVALGDVLLGESRLTPIFPQSESLGQALANRNHQTAISQLKLQDHKTLHGHQIDDHAFVLAWELLRANRGAEAVSLLPKLRLADHVPSDYLHLTIGELLLEDGNPIAAVLEFSKISGGSKVGMVLDLPAEVGTTMETSRYFWFQTVHGRPIPYTPDVRMGSTKDPKTFSAFAAHGARGPMMERPATPNQSIVAHIKETYAIIVVHRDLEKRAGLQGQYEAALTPVFGPPQEFDGDLVWVLR